MGLRGFVTSSENCSEVKTFSGLGHVPRMSVVSVAESDANAAVADGQEIDQRLVETGKVGSGPSFDQPVPNETFRIFRFRDDAEGSNPGDASIRKHVESKVAEHRLIGHLCKESNPETQDHFKPAKPRSQGTVESSSETFISSTFDRTDKNVRTKI